MRLRSESGGRWVGAGIREDAKERGIEVRRVVGRQGPAQRLAAAVGQQAQCTTTTAQTRVPPDKTAHFKNRDCADRGRADLRPSPDRAGDLAPNKPAQSHGKDSTTNTGSFYHRASASRADPAGINTRARGRTGENAATAGTRPACRVDSADTAATGPGFTPGARSENGASRTGTGAANAESDESGAGDRCFRTAEASGETGGQAPSAQGRSAFEKTGYPTTPSASTARAGHGRSLAA